MKCKKQSVLIVDDEPLNLEVLESYLNGLECGIRKAANGEQAIALVNEAPPDLVLLDVMMPGMDGFEVCRKLKEDERTRLVPVVIVTSLDQKSDKINAIKSGADDFITKPVDKNELLTRCKSLLRMKRYQDERDQAYSDIRRITLFLNDSLQKFDPLNFSLDAAYDNLFSTILQKDGSDGSLPTHALVVPYEKSGFSSGTLYWFSGNNISEKKLELVNSGALEAAFNFAGKKDQFINLPDGDGGFPPDISSFTGKVRNVVSCYSDGMLVACFNYCRPVTVYDLQVLKDLAMHSIFFETIAGQVRENEEAFLYTIKALARASEANDEDTGNHIVRVNEYSYEIALEMGLPEGLANEIRYSAQMHDVGKIHTPPSILQKPGKLTPEEWEEIKKHTVYGVKILGGSPRLEVARQIALNHHERWDGSGYPHGRKGEEIPLPARIVMISDVYDALRNKRVYKPSVDHETTCNIIIEGDGRTNPNQFDPEVLNIFKKIKNRFQEIYLEFKD